MSIEQRKINAMPITFKTNPYFTICFTSNIPEEKTIAFGGVPTGNINAKLAPSVNGMANCSIETPCFIANPATKGTKILTIAKFDKTSEAKTATTITVIRMV